MKNGMNSAFDKVYGDLKMEWHRAAKINCRKGDWRFHKASPSVLKALRRLELLSLKA